MMVMIKIDYDSTSKDKGLTLTTTGNTEIMISLPFQMIIGILTTDYVLCFLFPRPGQYHLNDNLEN